MNTHRVGSFVLLAGGVVLVFAGVSAALGFSVTGMTASAAAIAALLYAGGVWFGDTSRFDPSLILFTREMIVASGPLAGRPVSALFPDAVRRDVEAACRAALAGRACQFSSGRDPASQIVEACALTSADGIVFGVLLSGALARAVSPASIASAG